MSEATNQIVTVFRNRLNPGHEGDYMEMGTLMNKLVAEMPGFISAKTFTASDGERVTIAVFKDRESQDAWKNHPQHREAMARGAAEFYSEYSIHIAEVNYSNSFTRAD